jgi:hypothetical protein
MPSSVTIDSGQARWRNAAARGMSSSVPSRSIAGPYLRVCPDGPSVDPRKIGRIIDYRA